MLCAFIASGIGKSTKTFVALVDDKEYSTKYELFTFLGGLLNG